MSWGGLDQRQFPRVQARCDIIIHKGFGGSIQAQTENVGKGGVCVILKQELEKLSRLHLRLALESEVSPIECEGRVVWMVRSKEPASGKVSYDTGIEFVNLKPSDEQHVINFIQNKA